MTVPSGPVKLCSDHNHLRRLEKADLPPLLRLDGSNIRLEAASFYFSIYTPTIALFWKGDAPGSFWALTRVFKKWNLPDCRIIKRLTLKFHMKRYYMDHIDVLAARTHFIATQKPSSLPEASAIRCPWSETNTLL